MQPKQITLNAKGIGQILLGSNTNAYGKDWGYYILIKEDGYIRCYNLKGVAGTNDIYNETTMLWTETHIMSEVLKPLPEYYDAQGKCLYPESVIGEILAASKGKAEVTTGVFARNYDLFYQIQGSAQAEEVLNGIALDKFFKDLFGENVLKITENGFEFIQPLTFDIIYNGSATEGGPEEITVSPIDGVSPFEFSLNGENWQQDPVLTPTTNDRTVYVKDAAGTISTATLQPVASRAISHEE